jgi:O-antigen/teichoic acid export membrane protein
LGNFIAVIYWQANVDMLPKQVSTLLAGMFLGPQGAGLLRLSTEITKILSKPGELLQQVLFPDLVRMWNRGAAVFGTMLRRALLISALYGLVFIAASIAGGSQVLTAALGADYAQAAPLLSLLMIAATFELLATVLRTAGYAMSHAGRILHLHLISSVLYLILFVVLTPHAGLTGPGFAACIASLVPFGGMWALMRNDIRKQYDKTK